MLTSKFSHPHKDWGLQYTPAYRHKASAQRRSLTSVLYPHTTVHRHSPKKPHASFARTRARCRPPLIASGLVMGSRGEKESEDLVVLPSPPQCCRSPFLLGGVGPSPPFGRCHLPSFSSDFWVMLLFSFFFGVVLPWVVLPFSLCFGVVLFSHLLLFAWRCFSSSSSWVVLFPLFWKVVLRSNLLFWSGGAFSPPPPCRRNFLSCLLLLGWWHPKEGSRKQHHPKGGGRGKNSNTQKEEKPAPPKRRKQHHSKMETACSTTYVA